MKMAATDVYSIKQACVTKMAGAVWNSAEKKWKNHSTRTEEVELRS